MAPVKAPVSNMTIVAFRHRKPPALAKLLGDVRNWTESGLAMTGFKGGVKWNLGNEHATTIGCEIVRIDGGVFNLNWLNNKSRLRMPDLRGFCGHLKASCPSDGKLFEIRHGGFRETHCTCAGESRRDWECSSGAEFHSCDQTPYDASYYAYPEGPVLITGWPVNADGRFDHALYRLRKEAEDYGLLDKYHSGDKKVAHWKDDDWYFRLGAVHGVPSHVVEHVVKRVRQHLSHHVPVIYPVMLTDLSVVVYQDTLLKDLLSTHSIDEVIDNPDLIERLYQQIGHTV